MHQQLLDTVEPDLVRSEKSEIYILHISVLLLRGTELIQKYDMKYNTEKTQILQILKPLT